MFSDSQNKILRDLNSEGKRVEASILEAIRQSNSELQSTLVDFARQLAKNPRKYQVNKLHTDRDNYISTKMQELDAVSLDIHGRINADKPKRMMEYILSTLYFTQIRERRSQIHPAHRKTFDWIFQRSESAEPNQSFSNFIEWLEDVPSPRGLYWISGKPGSGKSTLMRYLSEDERTMNALAVWANSKSILGASCFFWLSGTEIQKSLNGLLRSLLHDLLTKVPSMIPDVAPWRWRAADFGSHLPPWTNSELLKAFQELVEIASHEHCLFIVIDGLDEFDGDNDQQTELLTFLISLSKSETIKICVSSRHYPDFQNAFEGFPSLKLEYLTHNDIKIVVEGRLRDLTEFELLQRIHPQASTQLISDVVNRAQGVFLWVYLVVRSLRQGVIDGDSMAALSRRLEEIPDDLDAFFRRIIDVIPRQQRKYACLYFRIMLAAPMQPPLLSLFFVEEEEPDFVEKTPLQAPHNQVVEARQRAMERRLESRCRGLLEAKKHDQESSSAFGIQWMYYVDFLHRSVRDFLLSKETQSTLNEYSSSDFDPNKFLCKSMLAQLKMTESHSIDVHNLSAGFLNCMRKLEQSSAAAYPRLFETFTTLLKHHVPNWPHTPESYVALSLAYSVERYATDIIRTGSLNLRSKCRHPLIGEDQRTLLEYSLFVSDLHIARFIPLEFAATALLEHGADPNYERGRITTWKRFLDYASLHSQLDHSWERVARAFVMNGAARKATDQIKFQTKAVGGKRLKYATNEPEDLAAVIERLFRDQGGKEIADILRENSSTLGRVKRIFARSPRS